MTANDGNTRRTFLKLAAGGIPLVGINAASAADESTAAKSPPARRVIPGTPGSPLSRAVIHQQLAFVSGVLGTKPGTRELAAADFEGQCRQVMENLKASVEAAGATMANVLKCTCFLTEESDFGLFNQVYSTFFTKDPPARSTVIVKALVLPDAKVEVDCVAALT